MHRLFFALQPDPAALPAIAVAQALAQTRALRGRWLRSANYHVTLHHLNDYPLLAPDLVERAANAATQVQCAPFLLEFDRLLSFRSGRKSPCVLAQQPQTDSPLQFFWELLRRALVLHGFANQLNTSFTPHLTLGYTGTVLGEPLAIPVVHWEAHEFVLIDSRIGESRHDILGRWQLPADGAVGPATPGNLTFDF